MIASPALLDHLTVAALTLVLIVGLNISLSSILTVFA